MLWVIFNLFKRLAHSTEKASGLLSSTSALLRFRTTAFFPPELPHCHLWEAECHSGRPLFAGFTNVILAAGTAWPVCVLVPEGRWNSLVFLERVSASLLPGKHQKVSVWATQWSSFTSFVLCFPQHFVAVILCCSVWEKQPRDTSMLFPRFSAAWDLCVVLPRVMWTFPSATSLGPSSLKVFGCVS